MKSRFARLLAALVVVVTTSTVGQLAASGSDRPATTTFDVGGDALDVGGKIVGGFPAMISDAPWQVMLVDYNESYWGPLYLDADYPAPISYYPFCGGSILSATVVITAAHCVDGPGFSGPLAQVLRIGRGVTYKYGADLMGLPGSSFTKVKSILVHPGWNPATDQNDLALLRLTAPLKLNGTTMAAIKLPIEFDGSTWPAAATAGLITGWGTLAFEGAAPNQLRSAEVDVLTDPSSGICGLYGGVYDKATMLCAGKSVGGVDTCQGDSGGPLAINESGEWYLAGITSFGFECAVEDYPGIYSRVTAFVDWIVAEAFVMLDVSTTGDGSGSVVSNVGGVECGATCSAILDPKTKVTLTATADPGSRFVGWSGACRGRAVKCILNPMSNVVVSANFELVELAVEITGSGSGSVTSSPAGINCVATCADTFNEKSKITLTAAADVGSVFAGWSGACKGLKPTCKVTMTSSKAVTATFTAV